MHFGELRPCISSASQSLQKVVHAALIECRHVGLPYRIPRAPKRLEIQVQMLQRLQRCGLATSAIRVPLCLEQRHETWGHCATEECS